jgi:hypothetical protein
VPWYRRAEAIPPIRLSRAATLRVRTATRSASQKLASRRISSVGVPRMTSALTSKPSAASAFISWAVSTRVAFSASNSSLAISVKRA